MDLPQLSTIDANTGQNIPLFSPMKYNKWENELMNEIATQRELHDASNDKPADLSDEYLSQFFDPAEKTLFEVGLLLSDSSF